MTLPDGFDAAYYLMVYGDVAEAGMDPIDHYLRFGRAEGRSGIPPGSLHPAEQEMRGPGTNSWPRPSTQSR